MRLRILSIMAVVAVLSLVGCTKSQQARNTEVSGFLGNYSMLRKGGDGEALFTYRKSNYRDSNIPWRKYNKVMIDPVVIWMDKDSEFSELDGATRQELSNRFYYYVRKEMSKVTEVVKRPSVGVARFQIALTDVESSNPLRDAISTVLPFGVAISAASEVLTGEPTNVGGASVEIKVSDAMTGEILGAAIDRRIGGKYLDTDTVDKWADVDEIMQYWAKFMAYKTCIEMKYASFCTKPQA